MTTTEFRLPDVGEGLTEAEIVTWRVRPGDTVAVNDVLLEIETAKSVVELPSPVAGTIAEITAEEGSTARVGDVLVSITSGDAKPAPRDSTAKTEAENEGADEDKPLVLVGTGPTAAADRRRRLRPRDAGRPSDAGRPTEADRPPPAEDDIPSPPSQRTTKARAKPPVRLLARTLGVDLEELAATVSGVITREDVSAAANSSPADARPTAPSGERETRTPIKGHRKTTAAAMVRSAFTAPHVTEFLAVDVTATMELMARLKAEREWTDQRLTPLALVAKCLLLAVRRYPEINTRWDEDAQEIVQHHYVNLGIAAATPRGLVVPNIKDAEKLTLRELAAALDELVQVARSGRTSPAQMAGGTITITNIGSFGVDSGTPILNPGEAAILAFGAIREMPWVVDGQVVPRRVTQLALSFDHRLVDGELGSRVLAEVGRLLHDPALALALA
jgi:pyruvate dehydrogenase E2 component (dihydrolipoamide acetyltransferase)